MWFAEDPANVNLVWTNDPDLNGERVPMTQYKCAYVKAVAVHEFGHTFGLNDAYVYPFINRGGTEYTGIMKDTSDRYSLSGDDINLLRDVYLGHTKRVGW